MSFRGRESSNTISISQGVPKSGRQRGSRFLERAMGFEPTTSSLGSGPRHQPKMLKNIGISGHSTRFRPLLQVVARNDVSCCAMVVARTISGRSGRRTCHLEQQVSFNPLPALPRGETRSSRPRPCVLWCFNPLPALPRGETQRGLRWKRRCSCFNPLPALPRGETTCAQPC